MVWKMKYILFILVFIAGASKAIMDTLQFHFSESIFNTTLFIKQFWDASVSWQNKYSTWLPDAFTDGWHGSQSVFLFTIFSSILFYRPILIKSKSKWISNVVVDFMIMRAIFGAAFILFYNSILIK